MSKLLILKLNINACKRLRQYIIPKETCELPNIVFQAHGQNIKWISVNWSSNKNLGDLSCIS